MPALTKIRVLIPTTGELVEVLLLGEEDPSLGRSVACIGGTTQVAKIEADYNAFVARPTGIIDRLYGHRCYRIDFSGPIDAGSSWQLGVLAAHALHATGRLAQEQQPADIVLWATGAVRSVDLTVTGVSHIATKLRLSAARLLEEARMGRKVAVAIPSANADDMDPAIATQLKSVGVMLLEVATVGQFLEYLALPSAEANALAGVSRDKQAPVSKPRRTLLRNAIIASGVAAIAGIAAITLFRHGDPLLREHSKRNAETQAPTERKTQAPRPETSNNVHGWIGLGFKNIDRMEAANLGIPADSGVLVTGVAPNGPAALADVRVGDAIVWINGKVAVNSRETARMISELPPHARLRLKVVRDPGIRRKELEIDVVLGVLSPAQ